MTDPTSSPRSEPSDLPTVVLVDGEMYWIKSRHTNLWTVAKWELGSFWGIDRADREVSPSIICGPIPRPAGGE